MPLAVFLIVFYGFSLVVLSLVSSIYLMVRFYKNLFTAEGYLMFTLPVTPVQLLNSKLITAYSWICLNLLLTLGSISALAFTGGYYSAKTNGIDEAFFSISINGVSNEVTSFQEIFGYSASELLLLCIIVCLVNCFFSLTMGYISICLGQLIEKYKLICSIAFYVVFLIITQVLSSVILIISNFKYISVDAVTDPLALSRNIYGSLLPITGIISLILGILFYIIIIFIIRRKVNLE